MNLKFTKSSLIFIWDSLRTKHVISSESEVSNKLYECLNSQLKLVEKSWNELIND